MIMNEHKGPGTWNGEKVSTIMNKCVLILGILLFSASVADALGRSPFMVKIRAHYSTISIADANSLTFSGERYSVPTTIAERPLFITHWPAIKRMVMRDAVRRRDKADFIKLRVAIGNRFPTAVIDWQNDIAIRRVAVELIDMIRERDPNAL